MWALIPDHCLSLTPINLSLCACVCVPFDLEGEMWALIPDHCLSFT